MVSIPAIQLCFHPAVNSDIYELIYKNDPH